MQPNNLFSSTQIALLRESFAVLATDAEIHNLALFNRLFELDPDLRFLFPEDLHPHWHRLVAMIGYVVRRLDRWDRVEPRIRNLGLRHTAYGARTADYATFERAIRDVIGARLGLSEDSPTMLAWSALFSTVSRSMIEAAESSVGSSPAFEPA